MSLDWRKERNTLLSALINHLNTKYEFDKRAIDIISKRMRSYGDKLGYSLRLSFIQGLERALAQYMSDFMDDLCKRLGVSSTNIAEYKVDCYVLTKNFKHSDDYSVMVQTKDGAIKGFIICDGVTRAHGKVASKFYCEGFKKFICRSTYQEIKLTGMRAFLDGIKSELDKEFRDFLARNNLKSSASTLIIVLTDGKKIFAYYIGDGYIYVIDGDTYSLTDILIKKGTRSGRLLGFLGYENLSLSDFIPNYMELHLDANTIIVLAGSDGTLLELRRDYGLEWIFSDIKNLIKDKISVRDVIHNYLEKTLPNKEKFINEPDDATLGLIKLKFIQQ